MDFVLQDWQVLPLMHQDFLEFLWIYADPERTRLLVHDQELVQVGPVPPVALA